ADMVYELLCTSTEVAELDFGNAYLGFHENRYHVIRKPRNEDLLRPTSTIRYRAAEPRKASPSQPCTAPRVAWSKEKCSIIIDFRHPEVLLVNRICEFEATGRSLEELADPQLDREYKH
ncbi:Protein crumbs-like protein 1, partial [Bienertia sinuspersici]